MKKVLILTIVAIFALGVFALANTAGYSEIESWGPSCFATTLTVHSVIGIEQGYVATATSYNASFCGALGIPLEPSIVLDQGVLLAELTVQSNMSTITVNVNYSGTLPTGMVISYLNNGSAWTGNPVMALAGGSYATLTPWAGTIQAVTSDPTGWANGAGQYTVTFTFNIVPLDHF